MHTLTQQELMMDQSLSMGEEQRFNINRYVALSNKGLVNRELVDQGSISMAANN